MLGFTIIKKSELKQLHADLKKAKETITLKCNHIKELNFQIGVLDRVVKVQDKKLNPPRDSKGQFAPKEIVSK